MFCIFYSKLYNNFGAHDWKVMHYKGSNALQVIYVNSYNIFSNISFPVDFSRFGFGRDK